MGAIFIQTTMVSFQNCEPKWPISLKLLLPGDCSTVTGGRLLSIADCSSMLPPFLIHCADPCVTGLLLRSWVEFICLWGHWLFSLACFLIYYLYVFTYVSIVTSGSEAYDQLKELRRWWLLFARVLDFCYGLQHVCLEIAWGFVWESSYDAACSWMLSPSIFSQN